MTNPDQPLPEVGSRWRNRFTGRVMYVIYAGDVPWPKVADTHERLYGKPHPPYVLYSDTPPDPNATDAIPPHNIGHGAALKDFLYCWMPEPTAAVS